MTAEEWVKYTGILLFTLKASLDVASIKGRAECELVKLRVLKPMSTIGVDLCWYYTTDQI